MNKIARCNSTQMMYEIAEKYDVDRVELVRDLKRLKLQVQKESFKTVRKRLLSLINFKSFKTLK